MLAALACTLCGAQNLPPPPVPPMPSGPSEVLAATLLYPMNVGESIEYDATNNRLVIGSLSTGRIIGITLPEGGDAVSFDAAEVHTYFSGSADVFATAGLQVDQDDECLLYAAVGGYPSRTSASGVQMGLATINMCEDRLEHFTNLTALATGGSMANDLTRVENKIFVTDFLGGQVLVVEGQNTAHPTAEKVMDFPGANGIESVDDDTLLISSVTGGYVAKFDIPHPLTLLTWSLYSHDTYHDCVLTISISGTLPSLTSPRGTCRTST